MDGRLSQQTRTLQQVWGVDSMADRKTVDSLVAS
jgi:hypothetical protein